MVSWELWLVPAAFLAAGALAEWLHGRRCRRMAFLAFGPGARPRRWVRITPAIRVLAVVAISWGLLVLLRIDRALWKNPSPGERRGQEPLHHLVIALDVSPSMNLEDAGPGGKETRGERGRALLRSILDRIDQQQTGVSIIAFYNEGRPVVLDTSDPEVVANILNDLPLEHAFEPGKTNLYSGVEVAAEVSRSWRPRSTTLMVASDGDTLPGGELPRLPPAISSVLVLGLGNPYRGIYIDGHSSRQDAGSLKRLALRLGGRYHDGNRKHVPTEVIEGILRSLSGAPRGPLALRDLAILAVAAGGFLLAFLPPLLALFGTSYRKTTVRRGAVRPGLTASVH